MSDNIPKPFPMKKLVAPEKRVQRVSNKAQRGPSNPAITNKDASRLIDAGYALLAKDEDHLKHQAARLASRTRRNNA